MSVKNIKPSKAAKERNMGSNVDGRVCRTVSGCFKARWEEYVEGEVKG